MAKVLANCGICSSPYGETIDKMLRAKQSVEGVIRPWLATLPEFQSKEPWHRNTIYRHKADHLQTAIVKARRELAGELKTRRQTLKGPTNRDLAELVRDKVVEGVEAGELFPSITEGLQAQKLIDARVAKQGERNMVLVMLQQVMGGAMPLALPEPSIEAEYEEVPYEPTTHMGRFIAEHARG